MSEKNIAESSVNNDLDIKKWLNEVPEISIMAEIRPIFVCAEDKPLRGIELWQTVGQIIAKKIKEIDGFVVLTGVDEVLNLGIALSFALQNLNKPVILTGSQITSHSIELPDWQEKKKKAYGGLGVKANLINAVQLVNLGLPAVALMFGNRIISPVKARRIQTLGLNLFDSADDKYLGRIDFGISLSEKINISEETKMVIRDKFCNQFQIINYLAGTDLNKAINQSVKGIIIRDLPDLEQLDIKRSKTPMVVYNPFIVSASNQFKNIFIANNLTWEAALIKFMWALANYTDPLEAMEQEYCHEFIKH